MVLLSDMTFPNKLLQIIKCVFLLLYLGIFHNLAEEEALWIIL